MMCTFCDGQTSRGPEMFARLKMSGGRAYVQVVISHRNAEGQSRQRVLATLGRVDHLTDEEQFVVIAGLSAALQHVRPTRAERVKGGCARGDA